ncbi:hypothetical protein HK103_004493 [Boothiomyces macroporosus]|uniref:Essential for reactive oxygen species protein n=1 Tax=Boothiomyces macroporosus TaxID=261099 RepID=A0AAD5UK92_9FUNG|nr:hypothetical protein HK103_004493 [Boothiomyces macroporosus]KAJ3312386.1 hypothetical protein HDV04_003136 [Boothiomyces sp. JEL0838]
MNFLADLKKINPKLKKTDNTLQFVTIEPTTGDWIMVTFIILAGIPLSWYTTYSMHYYYVVLSVYFLLAYSLVDDKFETIIDKEKNSIVVTKTKLGRKKWERASVADELIQAEVVHLKQKGIDTYILELEFMSEFGYYRLQTSETAVVGEYNKNQLEMLAKEIRDFMGLKPMPDWMKEENLKKTFPNTHPANLTKRERDQLRRK